MAEENNKSEERRFNYELWDRLRRCCFTVDSCLRRNDKISEVKIAVRSTTLRVTGGQVESGKE
jgi:hypothetical protein